jgi:hypothetical protein
MIECMKRSGRFAAFVQPNAYEELMRLCARIGYKP